MWWKRGRRRDYEALQERISVLEQEVGIGEEADRRAVEQARDLEILMALHAQHERLQALKVAEIHLADKALRMKMDEIRDRIAHRITREAERDPDG